MTLGEESVFTLSYDNMVLIAEGEDKMRNIINRLESYMDKKELEVSVEKAKIMRFKKGEGERRW